MNVYEVASKMGMRAVPHCKCSLGCFFYNPTIWELQVRILPKFKCFKWVVNIRKLSSFEQIKCSFEQYLALLTPHLILSSSWFFSATFFLHCTNLTSKSWDHLPLSLHLSIWGSSLCLFCSVLDWLGNQWDWKETIEPSGSNLLLLFSGLDQSCYCLCSNCCVNVCVETST